MTRSTRTVRATPASSRQRRMRLAGGAGGVVLAGVVAATFALTWGTDPTAASSTEVVGGGPLPAAAGSTAEPAVSSPAGAAPSGAGLPPWSLPADPAVRFEAAGLQISDMSAMKTHFHPHLDILVEGRAVPVAANIGIDPAAGTMSELHTHDESGIVHIESSRAGQRYTLGQLFTEWGVRLDATHLGGLVAGDGTALTAYVDGDQVTGDPADIELLAHRQIALVYGPTGQQVDVPADYDFPDGA